jgi:hypothetical protein
MKALDDMRQEEAQILPADPMLTGRRWDEMALCGQVLPKQAVRSQRGIYRTVISISRKVEHDQSKCRAVR